MCYPSFITAARPKCIVFQWCQMSICYRERYFFSQSKLRISRKDNVYVKLFPSNFYLKHIYSVSWPIWGKSKYCLPTGAPERLLIGWKVRITCARQNRIRGVNLGFEIICNYIYWPRTLWVLGETFSIRPLCSLCYVGGQGDAKDDGK